MTIPTTVAADLYLKQLKELVATAMRKSMKPADYFFDVLAQILATHVVGTQEELRELRRLIILDAIGQNVRRDRRVRTAVRHLGRTSTFLAPRAAGVGGSSAGHRFGVGICG